MIWWQANVLIPCVLFTATEDYNPSLRVWCKKKNDGHSTAAAMAAALQETHMSLFFPLPDVVHSFLRKIFWSEAKKSVCFFMEMSDTSEGANFSHQPNGTGEENDETQIFIHVFNFRAPLWHLTSFNLLFPLQESWEKCIGKYCSNCIKLKWASIISSVKLKRRYSSLAEQKKKKCFVYLLLFM